jgi:hypothetical protein
MDIDLILWIAAIVCWLIAAFSGPDWRPGGRLDLVALGLALAGITFVV